MPRSAVEQLAGALDAAGQLIEGVRDDQWIKPTPCVAWSVRELVDHLITGNQLFARVLSGDSPSMIPADADRHRGKWAAAYRESADALLAAFGSAGVMDRVVTVPFGPVPGIVALHLRLVEALVHGWDLAQATGQSPWFDEELAEQELEFTRAKLAEIPPERSPFAAPRAVAEDAPALDRLAACLGRDAEGPGDQSSLRHTGGW